MKTLMRFITFLTVSIILTCCVAVGGNGGSSSGSGSESTSLNQKDVDKAISRSATLDALYDNTTLGEVNLTFSQDNWNKLVSNSNSRNKTLYSTCDYKYIKGDNTYDITGIGIKNRGNFSFRAPQDSSGNYQQAHFKCKLNKYTDDNDHQLAKAAKTMNLKFMLEDASYVQEIYCYDLFKRFGVWTAPRASYTKLYIKVGDNEKSYFGIYKAIENVDKQYLKARIATGRFTSDKGNLWKCLYQADGPANLKSSSDKYFGVDTASRTPVYSLKTNDDTEEGKSAAISQFKSFISNLNSKSGSDFKKWIASAFDVDGFLKALAVDVSCGMWDDIWRNFNNYYFYFDINGKAFFIPYDYDNSLGVPNSSLMPNPAEKNPLKWGQDNSILVKKILDVDEYMTKYKQYLSELASSSNDYLCWNSSKQRISSWYSLIKPYCTGYNVSTVMDKGGEIKDWFLHENSPCGQYNYIDGDSKNYFTLRIAAINNAVGGSSGGNGGDNGSGENNNNNTPTAELLGYSVSDDNITFTFDPKMYGLASVDEDLYICAGFTGWNMNGAYKMTESNGVWSLSVSKSTATNGSEYKYRTASKWYGVNNRIDGYKYPSGYSGDQGNIIIKY